MRVTQASKPDTEDWLAMRSALWPDTSLDEHRADIATLLAKEQRAVCFLARLDNGAVAGFAEVSLRHDYVNGCATSPVGFLEGLYVVPAARKGGIARALVAVAQDWALHRGCSEFASDVLAENVESQKVHVALGFSETDRVVYFHKLLVPQAG